MFAIAAINPLLAKCRESEEIERLRVVGYILIKVLLFPLLYSPLKFQTILTLIYIFKRDLGDSLF